MVWAGEVMTTVDAPDNRAQVPLVFVQEVHGSGSEE